MPNMEDNKKSNACYGETNHCSLWDSDKGTVFGEVLLTALAWTFFISPKERDDKRELIKAGHYALLKRATLLSQPENEQVYSLGDYVAVC